MDELPRLKGSLPDGLAQRLLESVELDQPTAAARARVAAAIGLGEPSPRGGEGTGGGATGAATPASAPAPGRTGPTLIGSKTAGWVLGIAGAGAAVLLVSLRFAGTPEPARAPRPQGAGTTARAPDPTAEAAAPDVRPAGPVPPAQPPEASVAPREPSAEPPAVSHARRVEHTTGSLADEVLSIDRARSALAAGQAAETLELLRRHDRRFPAGALAPEVAVIRVEALLLAGRTDEARSLAARHLRRDPASPHARRLRSLLGRHDQGQGAP